MDSQTGELSTMEMELTLSSNGAWGMLRKPDRRCPVSTQHSASGPPAPLWLIRLVASPSVTSDPSPSQAHLSKTGT